MAVLDWIKGLRVAYGKQTVYAKIEDNALTESAERLFDTTRPTPSHCLNYVLCIVNALVFLISMIFVLVAYTLSVTDSQCVEQLYTWCESHVQTALRLTS